MGNSEEKDKTYNVFQIWSKFSCTNNPVTQKEKFVFLLVYIHLDLSQKSNKYR
eukprot:m.37841 g.37841  ORF g.37841 m.37841 type:complete len:53 (-) comp9358_c0_seq2:34-192(-)